MASDNVAAVVKECLAIVKKKEGCNKLKLLLGMCNREQFIQWKDEKQMDVLHHTILSNNPEVVEYLLTHGYFVRPFEPEVSPYIHLAAYLGFRTIINILLTHRPGDNRPSKNLKFPDESSSSRHVSGVTPLDVAASAGHLESIHLILNQCVIKAYPEHAKCGYLSLATLAGSSKAVNFLLSQKYDKKDLLRAVEFSISGARSEILDSLLGTGVNTCEVMRGTNLYHALYTNSALKGFGREGYKRLPDVTSVLIKYHHDVNTKSPCNTYPLYSLLRNSLCAHDYINTQYYLACLKLLLKANTNPNFDEVRYEKVMQKKGNKSIVGRPAFSSALHCLLDTVEIYASYLDSKALAVKFITECSDVLFRFDADVHQVGRLGDNKSTLSGSVLHQYAKSSVKLGVDAAVLKVFLRQGANPDIKAKGKYCINVFTDSLFVSILAVPSHKTQPDRTADIDSMLDLCRYMSAKSIQETLQVFNHEHGRNNAYRLKSQIARIKSKLVEYSKSVAPLQRICANYIWQRCGRNANNIHSLPLKIRYKTEILPIV
ncbi:uncharacterized protein LOC110441858 [Mizuhopecten yessoensis]|uniref:Espin n=1 Tax=Mizuhopecten yessoensis TaxID=6573 RepID=A0A210PIG5_MIZYE|nr:uncharacterized protein LOC110441858 [Mizuhopecten yessoensis]XP_021340812.1 uncharacterized protein LOC110441858 [Mizuhopecten yessoensis]XP_021340813.1 uncharacterized protein LOC110441858 [Mizuhopecten yessoensis]OWF36288.1 Espin [Mizuhopecten yessoensis]